MLQSRNDAHLIWGKDRLASEFYGCSFGPGLSTYFALFISQFQHQSCQERDRSATPIKDKVDLDKVNILQVCTIKSHTLKRCLNGPFLGEKWCLSLARCVWSATRRLCDTGKTVYFVGNLSKDFLTDGLEAGSEAFFILKGLNATVFSFLVSFFSYRDDLPEKWMQKVHFRLTCVAQNAH